MTDIGFRRADELEAHPLNDEIYDDRHDIDPGLVASIERLGIIEPVVIDTNPNAGNTEESPTIISGHRRVAAAKEVGLEKILVREDNLESDLERREQLLAYNQDRNKTFSQQMREAEELERIEREQARHRQGMRTDIVENQPRSDQETDPPGEFGKSREKVADSVGIGSGRNYAKAKKVWNAAQQGDTVAKHEVNRLDQDNQSIHGAYEKVRNRIQKDDEQESPPGGNSEGAESATESKKTPDGVDSEPEQTSADEITLSAHVGRNDEIFPEILDLHVGRGSRVADVTYGKGVFWRQVTSGKYDLTATDIDPTRSPDSKEGVDCRDLPYEDASIDCVVLDPPYAEGFYESTEKNSDDDHHWIKDRYGGSGVEQATTYHEAVLEMYAAAGEEAYRVLAEEGLLIAKMQDEVSRNEQRLTHVEITNIYEDHGFKARDLFVVVRPDRPSIGRTYEQRRARKNHSYFMIFRKEH